MRELKTFFCDDKPTIHDIYEAFDIAKNSGAAVKIEWEVPHNGTYARFITADKMEKYTPEKYFEECIPHRYGV